MEQRVHTARTGDGQDLPEHTWHSPAGLGTPLELLCLCPSACTHLLQKRSFCWRFLYLGDAGAVAPHGPGSSESAQKRQKNAILGVEAGTKTKTFFFRNHPAPDPFLIP